MGFQFVSSRIHSSDSIRSSSSCYHKIHLLCRVCLLCVSYFGPASSSWCNGDREEKTISRVTSFHTTFPLWLLPKRSWRRLNGVTVCSSSSPLHFVVGLENVLFRINSKNTEKSWMVWDLSPQKIKKTWPSKKANKTLEINLQNELPTETQRSKRRRSPSDSLFIL